MTQSLIAKIKALRDVAEKATPGPWTHGKGGLYHPSWIMYPTSWREKIEAEKSVGALCWAADEDSHRDVIFRGGESDELHISQHNPAAMIALYDEMLKVLEHKEDGK